MSQSMREQLLLKTACARRWMVRSLCCITSR